jgi:hypothetical protein
MSEGTAVSLDALRARIRALEGRQVQRRRDPCGVPELDALVGGLPAPGVVELHGPEGMGATRLAARVLARHALLGRPVAWVDVGRRLYPPALMELGLDLRWLLLVRPPAGHEAWAAEQLLRSGCFPVVAISGVDRLRRAGARWAHAAEQGACTALVLARQPERALPADLRISVGASGLTVVRDRVGSFGRRGSVTDWPAAVDPFQRRACGLPA